MRPMHSNTPTYTRFATCLISFVLLSCAQPALAESSVTVTDDGETYTLSNDTVTAVVSKRSADLLSLTYKGTETLTPDSGGHSAAYWSHDVTGGVALHPRISIDPATNGGERAEVSIKAISGGVKMGARPGHCDGWRHCTRHRYPLVHRKRRSRHLHLHRVHASSRLSRRHDG